MDGEKLFKAVADKQRLNILASLLDKPKFASELALELNISVSTASFHLKKLEAVGFVVSKKEQYYQIYCVNREALTKSLVEIVGERHNKEEDAFYNAVVKECFVDGRLTHLPIAQKKREAVLKKISFQFEQKKVYTEREINLEIANVSDDFVTIREELVKNKLLTRKGREYCRQ